MWPMKDSMRLQGLSKHAPRISDRPPHPAAARSDLEWPPRSSYQMVIPRKDNSLLCPYPTSRISHTSPKLSHHFPVPQPGSSMAGVQKSWIPLQAER